MRNKYRIRKEKGINNPHWVVDKRFCWFFWLTVQETFVDITGDWGDSDKIFDTLKEAEEWVKRQK